jgi:antitoxin component YwqK of YwqJK toxin-antitoxin module
MSNDVYSFANSVFEIQDGELNVSYRKEFFPVLLPSAYEEDKELGEGHTLKLSYDGEFEKRLMTASVMKNLLLSGQHRSFHKNGNTENECFYIYDKESSTCLLHGPSTCFSENGKVLAKTWYINGKATGKSLAFYHSGKPYSILRYNDGVFHLKQEYFYENGKIKTIMPYKIGSLEGECLLYHENGTLFRKLFFKMNKRQGLEQEWAISGNLRVQRLHENNLLKEERRWNSRNILVDERIFIDGSSKVDFKKWSKEGKLIVVAKHKGDRASFHQWDTDGELFYSFEGYWDGVKVCMDKLIKGNLHEGLAAKLFSWEYVEEKCLGMIKV